MNRRSPTASVRVRGFTMVEVGIVVIIMAIVAVVGMDTIGHNEAAQRADRAARESMACFRFARNLAMSTGRQAEVVVSTANSTVSVYWMSNGSTWDVNPVATGMSAGGQMVVNTSTSQELAGTAITLNPVATNTFVYNALGNCAQTGVVTFTYGGRSKSLSIASVGDPVLQ